MANVVLALAWVVAGAVTVGAATALTGRRNRLSATRLASGTSVVALLISCSWLVLPVTALTRTIDTPEAGQIECGSAWGSLDTSPYISTDEGREYALGTGECRATAWHRVAALSAAEVGIAVVVGLGSALLRRRPKSAPREADQARFL